MAAAESEIAAKLIERLLGDPAFRDRFRRDPVRTCREARSFSARTASPLSVYEIPPYRHSVLATSDGWPLNGGASARIRSRNGTLFFRSPPSSASTQSTVAG